MSKELRDKLKSEIDIASWELLKPHLDRGALLQVQFVVDLLDIAYQVAIDNVEYIKTLMNENKLHRPKPAHIDKWDLTPDKKFDFVIVEPYVFIKEVLTKPQ